MNNFHIDSSAKKVILQMLKCAEYENAVARLYEKALTENWFEEFTPRLIDNKLDKSVDERVINRYEEIKNKLHFSVMIGIDNGDHFSKDAIAILEDIPFVMLFEALIKLRGHRLVYENGTFHIKDVKNSSCLLRDVFQTTEGKQGAE
jgi:hypothetical protein